MDSGPVRELFRDDLAATPSVTLRGGEALDRYEEPPPYDASLDAVTDEYIETFAFGGVPFLDPMSWRHYLPALVDYALRHDFDGGGMVVDALIWSLRPPDRDPPRLGSLTSDQETAVREFLELIAFGEVENPHRDFAMQVLEEWWLPGALYRPV